MILTPVGTVRVSEPKEPTMKLADDASLACKRNQRKEKVSKHFQSANIRSCDMELGKLACLVQLRSPEKD